MNKQDIQEYFAGAKGISPIAVGVAIYGLAFGLLAAQAGMDGLQTGLMGTFVLGGASQIAAVERLVAGAGATAAIVAGLALNLRLFLVTASNRDLYAGRPAWQVIIGAHFTTDENWALTHAKRAAGEPVGYCYLVGSGSLLMVAWVVSSVVGVLFATAIPEPRALGMDFAFAAAFIAIARSLWRGRQDVQPWLGSVVIVVATVWSGVLTPSWAIVLGGVGGAAIAAYRKQ